jgi:uncharacterized protein (TIGR02001 family)
MRKTPLALAFVGAFAVSSAALAEEVKAPAPDYTLTGNVTLASEYLYRGIAQSNHKPAIQGGFDYAHASGVYLGTWASSISWLSDQSSAWPGSSGVSAPLEMDVYGGYKGKAGDISYDVGVLEYYYPGKYPDGFTSPNTFEGYAAGTWKWLTVKGSYSFTNLFGAKAPNGDKTNGSYYLDATGVFDVGAGVNLTTHVGYQNVKGYDDASYTDWKLGVAKDAFGLSWGLSYIGTNAKGDAGQFYRNAYDKNLGSGRVVLTVGKTL